MKAQISVFVICVKAIIYLLLYNLQDCTFNSQLTFTCSKSTTEALEKDMKYVQI